MRTFVVVRTSQERSEVELYALVLSARAIESEIVPDGDGFRLLVAPERLDEANAEINAHDAENARRSIEATPPMLKPPNLEVVLIYWAILLFFFAAGRRYAFSIDWLGIGSAQAGQIRAGELWRAITALFLHVSGAHLLSNLVFGSVFILLLTQLVGAGWTMLAVVAAGAGGNLINALVRPPFHTSIGASTAIFGAIGLLAAMRQNWPAWRSSSGLRFWLPTAGGLMLLVFLGVSGERTDILAHGFGFLTGLSLGIILIWLIRSLPEGLSAQWVSGMAAAGLVAVAWSCAIIAG